MVEGEQLSEQGDRSSVVCPGSSLLALKEGLLIDVQNLERLNFIHLILIQYYNYSVYIISIGKGINIIIALLLFSKRRKTMNYK